MKEKEEAKTDTLLAFILGYILIDNLSSTEQNALGNWLMLVAQTLCTSGSSHFNREWKNHINSSNDTIDMRKILKTAEESLDKLNKFLQ